MRLYRFLSAKFGMRSVQERRIRIGRIEELNDDFELIGVALAVKKERITLRNIRRHLNVNNGVICMSKDWASPLMWAHYADSHKGMVLGFDVPARSYLQVQYKKKRPTLKDMGLDAVDSITVENIKRLLTTKAHGWSYEQEYRAYVPLGSGEEIDGETHYFSPFSEEMKLREVIVGSRYKGKRHELTDIVNDPSVDIYMSRGSFEDFRVVRQRQANMWP